MAKYIIAFTLLALLVLENSSIYNRLHVESLPSIRHQHRQHHTYETQHTNHPHHRHKRIHHLLRQSHIPAQKQKHVKRHIETTVKRESDEITATHLQRHQQHQLEHLLQHQAHYQRRTPTSAVDHQNLRSMPRPWQHLQQEEERMFGDEPILRDTANSRSDDEPFASYPDYEDLNEVIPAETFAFNTNIASNEKINGLETVELPVEPNNNNEAHNHQGAANRCPKCEIERQVEHITEEQLTQLRIEFVKTQILEKLRLKERPNVSPVPLPKPIYDGVTIDQGDDKGKNKELDDYYARTSKKFIFLERETRECKRTGVQPSICFSFKIDDADADGFDVNTAVLWIFKNKMKHNSNVATTEQFNSNNTINEQETLVISELQQPVDSKFRPIVKTIAIQTVDVQDKWLEIDIEWPIKRWFGNHDLSHLIQISCESCDISSIEEMISIDKDYRPFIMIDTQNRRRTSRQKRGINCTDGVTECCREKLYISFDEIGWGDWIIQPRGYDAYFCRGSCGTVASVTQSTSHHSSFLQKVIAMNRGKGQKPLELIPCCTAKQYSSLQLVFMDSNNTATQKTFPNMVIESCGCR